MSTQTKVKKQSDRNLNWHSLAVILNSKAEIKFISENLADMLGHRAEDLLGKNSIDLFIEESDREERRSQLEFLYKQDAVVDAFEIALQGKNSKKINLRFSIVTIPPKTGISDDIGLIGDDLSTSKKLRKELTQSDNEFAGLVDASREFIIIIDGSEKVKTANRISETKLGITANMKLKDLLDPVDGKRTSSFLDSLGKISSIANINLVFLHPKTKQRFYLSGTVSSIVVKDILKEFRLILKDITEQIKSEKAKDLYYAIAHHTIHTKNLDDLYYKIHQELKQVVDCENLFIALIEEEAGQKFILFPYYQESYFQPIGTTKRRFAKGLTEYIITTAKPKLFTKEDLIDLEKNKKITFKGKLPEVWLGVPLKVQSEVIGVIAIQSYVHKSFYSDRDLKLLDFASSQIAMAINMVRAQEKLKITNKELIGAKDIAEASLLVKDQFLANMSHEIRTPLNGIIGVIDLLEMTELVKEQESYLRTIKSSSETLINILNDILDLSKIEAGKMSLRPSAITISGLTKKLRSLFTPGASTYKIKLKFHLDKKLPRVIEADEIRVIQVISNLMANSIKFTPKGGSIDIGFELKTEKKENLLIRVNVRDSGIGIKKEDIKKLFTNFTQLDNSTTKTYGGTGLGLSISKQLVTMLGGKIGVHSNPGLGSTFWFTFKAKRSTKKIISTPAKNILSKGIKVFTDTQPYILVVDDNIVNRDVSYQILKKSGCKVDQASNGIEAVFKAKTNAYDIIFMDIQMPELDGIEANRQIKNQVTKKRPWIIAMTAYSMKEDEERFLSAGLDDYLAKPIRATQLIGKVYERIYGVKKTNSENPLPEKRLKILNRKILNQLKKYGGKDMIVSALDDFELETEHQLETCAKALKNNDYATIQRQLHTLKGSSGTLGAEKIAQHAHHLESLIKREDYSALEQKLGELNDKFVEFKQNYINIISDY